MKKIRKASKTKLWKAIRAQCMDCVCESAKEVDLCTSPKCSLFPFRYGREINSSDLGVHSP